MANSFIKPGRTALDQLVADETLRDTYTESLALIYDLLCDFSNEHGHSRFHDEKEIQLRLLALITPTGVASSSGDDPSAMSNIRQNITIASGLRREAEASRNIAAGLEGEITRYLDALVATYGEVLRLTAGGLQVTQSRRA